MISTNAQLGLASTTPVEFKNAAISSHFVFILSYYFEARDYLKPSVSKCSVFKMFSAHTETKS